MTEEGIIMKVHFPNLNLDPPTPYKPISNLNSSESFREQLQNHEYPRDVNRELKLLQTAVDNTYVYSYKVLGLESHSAEALDYIGIAQLLGQNYWSGYYHCCRSLYLDRGRERLQKIVERLKRNREKNVEHTPSQDPLTPFHEGKSLSVEEVVKEHQKLIEYEKKDCSDTEEWLELAKLNLRLASKLLSFIHAEIEEVNAETNNLEVFLSFCSLLSFQPRKSKELAGGTAKDCSDGPFLPSQLIAYSEAMVGDYLKAARTLSKTPKEVLEENPFLVDECYRCYKYAGAGAEANQFVEENRVPGSMNQYYPNKKQKLIQMFGRLRGNPPILMSTISKSGSTYLTNEVQKRTGSEYMKIMTGTDYTDRQVLSDALDTFSKGGLVCRQHFQPHDDLLSALSSRGIDRILFHIRDPRRALISWTFYQESTLRKNKRIGGFVRGTNAKEYAEMDFQDKIENQIENFLKPTVSLIQDWIDAEQNNPHGIKIKITKFEDMVSDPDPFFEEVVSFFGAKHHPFFKKTVETARSATRKGSEYNKNKKRDSDVDEWEEYISDPLKQEILNSIPSSIKSLYPEKDWTV